MAKASKEGALKRLDHIRDGLLHARATIDIYINETKEVRDMIDPPEKGGTASDDDAES